MECVMPLWLWHLKKKEEKKRNIERESSEYNRPVSLSHERTGGIDGVAFQFIMSPHLQQQQQQHQQQLC